MRIYQETKLEQKFSNLLITPRKTPVYLKISVDVMLLCYNYKVFGRSVLKYRHCMGYTKRNMEFHSVFIIISASFMAWPRK